jgi:eukaryotic-like serine/threonine-protein kinase
MKTCPNCRAIYPDSFAMCPQDATPLTETEGWSEGSIVRGKYRILGKLGQGGMGAVYKGLHLKFNQLRALKVMSKDLASDPDFVKRFEREAILMSKLQHANVVRVDDIDETEDGCPYIVMEFVEGSSLRQVMQEEGPQSPLRVCSIAKQAAAGLGAAHLLGMVHRDVKPDNIVLLATPEGERAKVLDFGIAKLKEATWGDGLHTATGVIIGTPQYFSPEQAKGMRSEELDGRSDLYSLGIVMYQMLTQQLPYKADSAVGWMMAHIQVAPAPIPIARPDLAIPDTLIDLVMQCLEKDRELRPPNAQDLIRRLERVEEKIRQPAKEASRVEPVVPIAGPSVTVPVPVVDPAPKPAPRAISTSRWARGWRFWVGFLVTSFAPFILGPLYDLIPVAGRSATCPLSTAGVAGIIGGAGWCLLTRRHWAFRMTSLLPMGLFAVFMGVMVYGIYSDLAPWAPHRAAPTGPVTYYVPQTLEELKQLNRPPLMVNSADRSINEQTQQPVFNLSLQNISSDARVTDWKADIIEFDAKGKALETISPVNRDPMAIDPGKTTQTVLSGGVENVSKVKVVFEKVSCQLLTSDGKEKGAADWENAHLKEDLAKAKQP